VDEAYRRGVADDDEEGLTPHEIALQSFERDVVLALEGTGFTGADIQRRRDPFDERRRTLKPDFETAVEHYEPPTISVGWRPRFGGPARRTQHERYAESLAAAGFNARIADDRMDAGVEVTHGARVRPP